MVIEVFIEDESGFLNWCEKNPNGYVININGKTATTNSRNKIHRQRCGTLRMKNRVDRMTISEHPKYCHNDLAVLEAKADTFETAWEYCGTCMKSYKGK